MERSLSAEELRYYILYWDEVVIPGNNLVYIGVPEEEELISCGAISRPRVAFQGAFQGDRPSVPFSSNVHDRTNCRPPLIIVVALVAGVWRLASRRQSLPCPVWLRWLVEIDNPFTKTNRAAFIVETLSLSPGMTVLDAGCGPGRLTVPLARGVGQAGRVVALDIQAGMLARAKAKAEAAGLSNVEFVAAALGDDVLPAEHFDRAVLVTVLGEIPDRAAAFAELFRTLKSGGLLAVVEVVFDPHFQTRATVTSLANATGFRPRDCFGHRLAYVALFEKPHE